MLYVLVTFFYSLYSFFQLCSIPPELSVHSPKDGQSGCFQLFAMTTEPPLPYVSFPAHPCTWLTQPLNQRDPAGYSSGA